MVTVTPSFSKSSVFKIFTVHKNTKSWRFQFPPVERSVFKKLRFRGGLISVDGTSLTVEIKLRFQMPPAYRLPYIFDAI